MRTAHYGMQSAQNGLPQFDWHPTESALMREVILDTEDLGEAESVLSANVAKIRLRRAAEDAETSVRFERSLIGKLGLDVSLWGFDFGYDMQQPDKIRLCRVISGGFEDRSSHRSTTVLRPGKVAAFGIGDHERDGEVRRGRYEQLFLDRRLLSSVAGAGAGSEAPVMLTGPVPVTPAANRQLFDLIGHVAQIAQQDSPAFEKPLVASALEQYVATVLLATIPNNAVLEPTATDRNDSTPAVLRRAMSFVDDNAHKDVSLNDIAASVYVTPRALQYMFRKHRDCTPTEYLRRVRLHHAHFDLLAGTRADATVSAIAHRWGFAHVGRFAVYYRQHYGQSPHMTLRG